MTARPTHGGADSTKMWRTIETSLGITALASSALTFVLWIYFSHALPTQADIARGSVYELNTYGAIVYMTRAQMWLLGGLKAAFVVAFLVASWIEVTKRPFRKRS